MAKIKTILKMLYYVWYDHGIGLFTRNFYWKSETKRFGSWSDYYFLASENSDKE